MTNSMTAYAQYEVKSSWGNAIWKMSSVNQRYLEIWFYLPEQFRSLESIIRKIIRTYVTRGKIECSLLFEPNIDAQRKLILNKILVKQLIDATDWIKTQSDKSKINSVDILRWPGVITIQEQNLDIVTIDILNAFDCVMHNYMISRKTEGQILKALVEQRLKAISSEISKISTYTPEILQWQRKRLVDKLKDAGIQLENNNRLEQEIVFIAHRTDISEEIDRLNMHIQETFNILKRNEAIGRRLDFMMQEFNRESNTLASKSVNIDITNSIIEIKVLVEQIREQIQNIE